MVAALRYLSLLITTHPPDRQRNHRMPTLSDTEIRTSTRHFAFNTGYDAGKGVRNPFKLKNTNSPVLAEAFEAGRRLAKRYRPQGIHRDRVWAAWIAGQAPLARGVWATTIPVKRAEKEILRDFARIESNLSPENLHCDGEISPAQARVRERQLMADRAKLVKELGREPSNQEIWAH